MDRNEIVNSQDNTQPRVTHGPDDPPVGAKDPHQAENCY